MHRIQLKNNPTTVVVAILFVALIAFEVFNFDTSRFALTQILGQHTFGPLSWAAILAIAFCGIDFAGLIRVFTGQHDVTAWYLLGAWLLGATGNALLTWLAVGTVLMDSYRPGFVAYDTLLFYAPLLVALLVWLARILFISSLATAGRQLFGESHAATTTRPRPPARHASIEADEAEDELVAPPLSRLNGRRGRLS